MIVQCRHRAEAPGCCLAYGSRRRGFAVVFALMLMSLTVLLLISLLFLARLDLEAGIMVRRLQEARGNAIFALEEAIAALQEAAGRDASVTARADLLLEGGAAEMIPHAWTGGLRSDEERVRWLVSGSVTSPLEDWPVPDPEERVRLDGINSAPADPLWAPRVAIRTPRSGEDPTTVETGGYAWWVGDEGVKAPVGVGAVPFEVADTGSHGVPVMRQQMRIFSTLSSLWPDFSRSAAGRLLERVRTVRQAALLPGVDTLARRRSAGHYSVLSRALLTDPARGGWRVNLEDSDYTDAWIGEAVRGWLDSAAAMRRPAEGFDRGAHYPEALRLERSQAAFGALPQASGSPWHAPLPVITELKLSVGFFHTHGSDRRHRARFHVEAELWNPYGVPMEMSAGDPHGYRGTGARGFIMVWDGLPAYTVENLDTGASFRFDMSAFDSSLRTNTVSNSMIHTWVVFRDGLLLPGETYHLLEPDPILQEEGLQRRISDTPWLWSEDGGEPAAAEAGNWLAPDHVIRFTPDQQAHRVTVFVFPFQGVIPRAVHPLDYGEPVYVLRDIPYRAEAFELFGSEYTRRFSLEYSPADYRVAWYLRLLDDDESLERLMTRRDPREPVWDFNDPRVAEFYDIEPDPRATVMREDYFSSLDPTFFDNRVNSHENTGSARYGDLRLFDVPAVAPLSIGTLRHMPRLGKPAYSIGSVDGGAWNGVFDRYFFAGSTRYEPDGKTSRLWNPRLRVAPGSPDLDRGNPAAATVAPWLEIATPFNLHATSTKAWEAVLDSVLEHWRMSGTVVGADGVPERRHFEERLIAPVFRRPFSAHFGNGLSHDSDGNGVIGSSKTQGVRSLDRSGTVQALADAIVRSLQSAARQRRQPFRSIEAFLGSGLLEMAIADSGLNAGIPYHVPTHLNQGDLIALLAPFATVRSDVFVIRAYGETTHPITGKATGRAMCEAVVQRIPEYVAPDFDARTIPPSELSDPRNRALGRRFVVTRFRWLGPEDL